MASLVINMEDLDLTVFKGSEVKSTLKDEVDEKIAILKSTKLTRGEDKIAAPHIRAFLKGISGLEPEVQNKEIASFATSLLKKVYGGQTKYRITTDGNYLENLLKLGADPDVNILIRSHDFYGSPLHIACRNRSLAEIELLLKYKANPKGNNLSKITPLDFFKQSIVQDCQRITNSRIIPVRRRVELMTLRDDVEALFSKYAPKDADSSQNDCKSLEKE